MALSTLLILISGLVGFTQAANTTDFVGLASFCHGGPDDSLPCKVPAALQERFDSETVLTVDDARMTITSDERTLFHFEISGLDPEKEPWVLTAWLIYASGPSFPSFARIDLPLTSSYSSFCSGLCRDVRC